MKKVDKIISYDLQGAGGAGRGFQIQTGFDSNPHIDPSWVFMPCLSGYLSREDTIKIAEAMLEAAGVFIR